MARARDHSGLIKSEFGRDGPRDSYKSATGIIRFCYAPKADNDRFSKRWVTCQRKMRFLFLKILHILTQTFEIQWTLGTHSWKRWRLVLGSPNGFMT